MTNKRKNTVKHWGPRLAPHLATLAGEALKNYVSNKTATERHDRDEHPNNILYSANPVRPDKTHKKRASKSTVRKIKKQKKFATKVEKALKPYEKPNVWLEMAKTGAAYSDVVASSIPANVSNQWISSAVNLYTIHGGELNLNGDSLKTYPYVVLDLMAADSTVPQGASVRYPKKADLRIQTTVCRPEYVIKNTSNTTLFFDIYTFVAKVDITDANYAYPATAWIQTTGDISTSNDFATAGYTTTQSTNNWGHTPLDAVGFGSFWKLDTKTQLQLPTTGTCQFKFPGARKPSFSYGELDGKYAVKGKTQGMLIVAHGDISSAIISGDQVFTVSGYTQYHYKIKGANSEAIKDRIPANTAVNG